MHQPCASQCACCVHHSVHNTVMSPLTLHLYLNDTCHSTGLGYSILLTTMNRFRFPIRFLILHSTESSITRSFSIKKARPRKYLFEINNESGLYLKFKLLINFKLTVKSEAHWTISFVDCNLSTSPRKMEHIYLHIQKNYQESKLNLNTHSILWVKVRDHLANHLEIADI